MRTRRVHRLRLGCGAGGLAPTSFWNFNCEQMWPLFIAGLWPLRSDSHRETDNTLVLSFVGQTR